MPQTRIMTRHQSTRRRPRAPPSRPRQPLSHLLGRQLQRPLRLLRLLLRLPCLLLRLLQACVAGGQGFLQLLHASAARRHQTLKLCGLQASKSVWHVHV